MPQSNVTILGLLAWDPDLLVDNLNVPEGIEKEALCYQIARRAAAFEILYPDPEEMAFQLNYWSTLRLPIWTHLLATTEYEYNPIENYNMVDEWTDEESGTNSRDTSGTTSGTSSGTESGTGSTTAERQTTTTESSDEDTSSSQTQTTSRSAYDGIGQSMAMRNVESVTTSGTGSRDVDTTGSSDEDYTESVTTSGTTSSTTSGTTTGSEEGEFETTKTHTQTRTGNIGTMTTQQMIEQERAIALFSLPDIITNEFLHEFCLMVY